MQKNILILTTVTILCVLVAVVISCNTADSKPIFYSTSFITTNFNHPLEVSTEIAYRDSMNCYEELAKKYNKIDYISYTTFNEKAYFFAKKLNDPILQITYLNRAARGSHVLEDFDNMFDFLTKASEIINRNHLEEAVLPIPQVNITYQYLSFYYNKTNNFNISIFHAQKIKNMQLSSAADSLMALATYYGIGNVFYKKGEYGLASKYLHKALSYRKKSFDSSQTTYLYTLLSELRCKGHIELRDSSKEATILKTLQTEIIPVIPKEMDLLTHVYRCLAIYYIEIKAYDHAYQAIQKGLRYTKNTEELELIKAHICLKEGKYEKVLKILNQNQTDDFIADEIMGELKLVHKDTLAIKYFDHALEKVKRERGSDLLRLLQLKGKALKMSYDLSKDTFYLKKSHENYQRFAKETNQIRADYKLEESKYDLSEHSIQTFEGAIEVAFELFGQTANIRYLEEAFRYFEQSKSAVLLEKEEESNSKLPYATEIQSLQSDLNFYKDSLYNAKLEKNVEKENILNAEIFKIQNQLVGIDTIATNIQVITSQEVQRELLNDEKVLISYFWGKKNVYAYVLSRDSVQLLLIGKVQEIAPKVQAFTKSLTRKEDSFNAISYELYQTIFSDVLHHLPAQTQKIQIIPDGPLNKVAFQAFITQKPEITFQSGFTNTLLRATRYSFLNQLLHKEEAFLGPLTFDRKLVLNYLNVHYLFQDYIISYAYSATLLQNNKAKSTESNRLYVGFAPSYRSRLPPLSGAKKEVEAIQNMIKERLGEAESCFFDEMGTKYNFQKSALNAQIIHLASHATINESSPLHSSIHFYDDSLCIGELYNMRFKGELAVLSACQSGNGEMQKGEGSISLSRAFAYAGMPSQMMSLWKLNDHSGETLTIAFFDALLSGKSKDESLKIAQIKYLKEKNKYNEIQKAHPYYWASLVTIGDMKAVISSNDNDLTSAPKAIY